MEKIGASLFGLGFKGLRQTQEFRALCGQTANNEGVAHATKMAKI